MFKIFLALASLFCSVRSFAGDKVGNGGGLWTCSINHHLQQGVLVDLWEAQEEFGLPLIRSNEINPMTIVEERQLYIEQNLPGYAHGWSQVLKDSIPKIRFVNAELSFIDDNLHRLKPPASLCAEDWVYTQFANFTPQDQILIQSDLWNNALISPLHKAALIWHEAIYAWLREQFQDKDSVRARQIVGLLFSTLPVQQVKSRIEGILTPAPIGHNDVIWFCMIFNNVTEIHYGNYGVNQLEASTKTIQTCQEGANSFHCDEHGMACSQILDQSVQKVCQLKNYLNNKMYLGKGRDVLEAEFKAREQCERDTNGVHCLNPVTCQ